MGGILKILASNHSIAGAVFDFALIRGSDFSKAKLTDCAFVDETRFQRTNFTEAFLENCKFYGRFEQCDFSRSSWDGIDAHNACFEDCLFINVCFQYCKLRCATFSGCIFYGCSFVDCDLSRAHFSCSSSIVAGAFVRCDFDQASLPDLFIPSSVIGSENVPYIPMVCPDDGEFIGYKKAWSIDNGMKYCVLITLRIPADARRSSGFGRKCRCDKATVVKMEWISPKVHSNPSVPMARSIFDEHFIYTEGKEVTPRNGFCEDRWDVCSGGIHFFMNKQEAIEY